MWRVRNHVEPPPATPPGECVSAHGARVRRPKSIIYNPGPCRQNITSGALATWAVTWGDGGPCAACAASLGGAMPAQLAADNTTVQNISRATKKAKQKSIAAELASLSDKFSAIAGEVQEKVTLEHETQEDRLQSVEDHISRIQNALDKAKRIERIEQMSFVFGEYRSR